MAETPSDPYAEVAPLVSVIVPTYNGAAYIVATVECALNQTFSDIEVIVVDDGSTDHTAEVLAHFHDRIRYIRKKNGGPASARNRGIEEARGRWIAFLDGDDLWQAEKIEKQLVYVRTHPGTGMVHTGVRTVDPNNAVLQQDTHKLAPSGDVFEILFAGNHIATSSVLVKRRFFKQVGMFDERPEFISVEDYDMWLRIAAETKVGYLKEPLLWYRVHPKGISKNTARSYEGERTVLKKNLQAYKDRFPAIARNFNSRLARVYADCGDEYFYLNSYKNARREFAKAVALDPWIADYYGKYLKTFLSPGVVAKLRHFKWPR